MTNKQESKFLMLSAVNALLEGNPAVTASIPNMKESQNLLKALIEGIKANENEKNLYDKKKASLEKSEYKENLIDLTANGSLKMQAYASDTNNTALLNQVKITITDLRKSTEYNILNSSNCLYSLIEEHLDKTAPYLLNQDTQAAFKELIDNFEKAIPLPRQSVIRMKDYNQIERTQFDEADSIIQKMDLSVEVIRKSNAAFYNSYKEARKVIEKGTKSLQVRGTILDTDGTPLPFAKLSFRLQGRSEVLFEKESALKGGFQIKSLDEGYYEIIVEKMGFKTQTRNFVVRWDELTTLEIKLESTLSNN